LESDQSEPFASHEVGGVGLQVLDLDIHLKEHWPSAVLLARPLSEDQANHVPEVDEVAWSDVLRPYAWSFVGARWE